MPSTKAPLKTETRKPKQRRSQERVAQILMATAELICADGSRSIKVNDIASRAEISVGSIYQYFENVDQIIEGLAKDYFHQIKEILSVLNDRQIESINDVAQLISIMWDEYYAFNVKNPAMPEILIGALSTKRLQDLDDSDSKENADFMFEKMKSVFPKKNWRELHTSLYLISYYSRDTMRIALNQKPSDTKVTLKVGKHTVIGMLTRLADAGESDEC